MSRLSKARVEAGWVYLAVHPSTAHSHVKVGRSAKSPYSNDPDKDRADSRFRMLNFTLRTFGLESLQVAEAAHVNDMFEVELLMKKRFGCRKDCGTSKEMLDATLDQARAELRSLEQQYSIEV